ncbi:hypothetical protein NEDG_01224 [Nematocida displodere]|uniref:Uncharacterized protein n=1 Tax=Nematocida displodere TaxID=1805483 RepID=A0A177EAX7_9MICR|nr:hypothetical protein NEDG_01224 [Nematocida displodere]
MKHLEEETERVPHVLDELFGKIDSLEEHIPAFLNEDSEILGSDPQKLQLTRKLSQKEKTLLATPPAKRSYTVTYAVEEEVRVTTTPDGLRVDYEETEELGADEPIDWDIKVDGTGYFDAKGNYVKQEEEDSESDQDDWITVKGSKTKKKKTPVEEPLSYTAVQNITPPNPKKVHAKTTVTQASKTDPDTDSEGFTTVKDKKAKANKFKK